jgi:hypothetical protein
VYYIDTEFQLREIHERHARIRADYQRFQALRRAREIRREHARQRRQRSLTRTEFEPAEVAALPTSAGVNLPHRV